MQIVFYAGEVRKVQQECAERETSFARCLALFFIARPLARDASGKGEQTKINIIPARTCSLFRRDAFRLRSQPEEYENS